MFHETIWALNLVLNIKFALLAAMKCPVVYRIEVTYLKVW